MSKLDDFKQFVRNNPNLINYVNKNEMTWQKFYEMYDLYGDTSNIWEKYKNKLEVNKEVSNKLGITDILGLVKNIDLDSFQESIQSIQRVVEMIGDISGGSSKKTEYKPRPLYKHFDD